MELYRWFLLFAASFGQAAFLFAATYWFVCIPFSKCSFCSSRWGKPVLFALFYGLISVVSLLTPVTVCFGEHYALYAPLSVLAPLTAGLLAGPIAGVGAGVIGAVYCVVALPGEFGWIGLTLMLVLCGITGGVLFRWVPSVSEKPFYVFGVTAALLLIEYGFLLFFSEDMSVALQFAGFCAAPSVLAGALGVTAIFALPKEK